jgi:hypothetical protein
MSEALDSKARPASRRREQPIQRGGKPEPCGKTSVPSTPCPQIVADLFASA